MVLTMTTFEWVGERERERGQSGTFRKTAATSANSFRSLASRFSPLARVCTLSAKRDSPSRTTRLPTMMHSTRSAARRAIPNAHTKVAARRFAHKVSPPSLCTRAHPERHPLTSRSHRAGHPVRQRGPHQSPPGRRCPREGRLCHPRSQRPQCHHRTALWRSQGTDSG